MHAYVTSDTRQRDCAIDRFHGHDTLGVLHADRPRYRDDFQFAGGVPNSDISVGHLDPDVRLARNGDDKIAVRQPRVLRIEVLNAEFGALAAAGPEEMRTLVDRSA